MSFVAKGIDMKKSRFLLWGMMIFLSACTTNQNILVETETVDVVQPLETEITTEQVSEATTEDVMESAYQVREILIERDGQSIYGQAYIPGDGTGIYPTVIIGHGFSGSYRDNADHAEYFAENGIAAYVFDFRGGSNSSRSDGDTREMSVVTEMEDVKAVFAYFKTLEFVDPERLYLMGESQGGFAAALAAAQIGDDAAGLIMLYPAFVIPDHGKAAYASFADVPDEFNLWGVPLSSKYYEDIWDLDVYAEISKYTGDVLIFHGTRDELVDISYSERAVEVYQSAELVKFEGAGHGFYGAPVQQVSMKTVEFINQGKSNVLAPNLISDYQTIPSAYRQSMENGGTIERVDYTTIYQGQIYDKHAYVYLPAGYDSSGATSYNIFYLMHGGSGRAEEFFGGVGRSSSLKNILDHMIENNELDPVIVVTPSYYKSGQSDDAGLTQDFHEELLNDLMPAVEGAYHTYAQTPDVDGFRNSRDHRAFGGFSMGSVTTWYTFIYNLDYFKYYLPMSADSWIMGMMGGLNRPDETAATLSDVVVNSGYGVNDFFIYAITGTTDMAFEAETSQIEAMKAYTDTFIFGNDMNTSNLYYSMVEGGQHTYSYMNEYIYNALPYFFSE